MDIDHHERIDVAYDAALLARIEQMAAHKVYLSSGDHCDLLRADRADRARLRAEAAYHDALDACSAAHRTAKRQTEQEEEILDRAFTKIGKRNKP